MSGAGVDPGERARVLLLRGDELLAAGTPESLDEAMLAYQGGLEVAREPGVDDDDLARVLEERIATVRRRLESEPDEEDERAEDESRPAEEAPESGAGAEDDDAGPAAGGDPARPEAG